MTDAASAETFAPYIGRAVSLGDGPTLTLVAVDRHKSPHAGRWLHAAAARRAGPDRAGRYASHYSRGGREL